MSLEFLGEPIIIQALFAMLFKNGELKIHVDVCKSSHFDEKERERAHDSVLTTMTVMTMMVFK